MSGKKTINIKCSCDNYLAFDELTEFQGELKKREESDVEKIVRSILKYGFCFPFFVWKHDGVNHVLDGHGRFRAISRLDELGYKIPELPVVYVDCNDEKSARDLLLRLNSSYGRMTKESVLDFTEGFDIDFADLELPVNMMRFDDIGLPDNFEPARKQKKVKYIQTACPHCGKEILVDSQGNIRGEDGLL